MMPEQISARRRNPLTFLTFALVLNGIVMIWLGWYVYDSYLQVKNRSEQHLKTAELRGMILHLDEVLTMSARMAAATGDLQWEDRYREFEPKLDAAIKEAVKLEPQAYSGEAAGGTDAANIELVAMENRAFDLIRQGQTDQARTLLFSDQYERQKQIYAEGMAELGAELSAASISSLKNQQRRALVRVAVVILVIPFVIVGWLIVLGATRRWEADLAQSHRDLVEQGEQLASLNRSLDQKVAQRTDQLKASQTAALNIMEDTEQARKEAELTNVALSKEISERKQAEEALRRIEWLLTKKFESDQNVDHSQPYGNLVDLNTCRVVADVDEEGVLKHIVNGYLDLLDTSAAVYEKNGDYALGIFTSGWCRMLDQASRNLCDTDDNREALASGKWHCHESCWTQATKPAIETGQPVDIECCGGIRLYVVPIWAGGQVVGAINCGYGDPPRDPQQLQEIAEKYAIGLAELTKQANAYQSRPPFVIDIVKKRLATSAKVIGTMIESRQSKEAIKNLAKFPSENPCPVLRVSKDGIILYANSASVALSPEWGGQIGQSAPEYWRQLVTEALNSNETKVIDVECKGQVFSLAFAPVKEAGYVNLYASDVTWRKRAEDKLRDSEEKYRQLVNTLVDAVISIDCRMNVLVWNQGAERIFGYTQDEMLGQSVERIVPEEYKEDHDKAFVQFSKSGSGSIIGKTREVQGVRKDGTKVPIELSISSRKDGHQYIATATIRDITDRKHTEELMMLQSQELRRSNRELEQFAYIASHDLQEPLRMVASYTQLLARRYGDKLDKDANEFINYAVDGATRMRNLINALLEYSRVGTRGRQLEPVDCNAVFDNACENLQAAIEESNAKVTCDTLPTVMADEIQLMQLFQNLIGNAIKYRGTEAPKVHVWAKRINGQWSFSVSDNGIGIDPQHADRIFIAFQRLHNKKEYFGTGIGLAICRKIVERHGGKISVQSQEGQGSTFCFTLSASSEEAVPAEVDKQPCTTQ